MQTQFRDETGVSLIETMIAMLVLTIGAVGTAAVFAGGMKVATTGPNELIATQKAAEAIESVFSARDSRTISWAQLRNTDRGGIFLTGPRDLRLAGNDGIVNTGDDTTIETVRLPGPDQTLNTLDDKIESLAGFKREIQITDLSTVLRSVTVIITYQSGPTTQRYALTSYISAFA